MHLSSTCHTLQALISQSLEAVQCTGGKRKASLTRPRYGWTCDCAYAYNFQYNMIWLKAETITVLLLI